MDRKDDRGNWFSIPEVCYIEKQMKKIIAVLMATIYLGLFNYCAVCAMVTGQIYGACSEICHHEHGHDHDDHDDEHTSSHQHNSSNGSDPCCVNLIQPIPALLSTPGLIVKPDFSVAFRSGEITLVNLTISQNFSFYWNHGPPGLIPKSQEAFSSSLSSRAPPFPLPSL